MKLMLLATIVNNIEVTVFLVSLKAGGVALNLTEVGSFCFFKMVSVLMRTARRLECTSWIVGTYSLLVMS
jgi:hypothetical protein